MRVCQRLALSGRPPLLSSTSPIHLYRCKLGIHDIPFPSARRLLKSCNLGSCAESKDWLRHHDDLLVIVRRVHGGSFALLVAQRSFRLPHHVAPPVLEEVDERHGRDLDGEEHGPQPRAPAGPLLVRVQADVDVGDADDADPDAQEPVRQVPRASEPHTSEEINPHGMLVQALPP
jgi:hypothetical protein